MSEVKVDKRKIVSADRLEHMKKMREALKAKNEQKKEAKLHPKPVEEKVEQPKVVREQEPIEEQVEEYEEEEVPVPVKKPKSKLPPVHSNLSLQDEIQRYIEAALPPQFSKENRKKEKWQLRKQEIKDEILQSFQPTTQSSSQVSSKPEVKVAKPALDLRDLFC